MLEWDEGGHGPIWDPTWDIIETIFGIRVWVIPDTHRYWGWPILNGMPLEVWVDDRVIVWEIGVDCRVFPGLTRAIHVVLALVLV